MWNVVPVRLVFTVLASRSILDNETWRYIGTLRSEINNKAHQIVDMILKLKTPLVFERLKEVLNISRNGRW